MANEKTINARLQQKHDIKAHWELATKFIPKAGEIIVYDDLNKIKIGDGINYVNNLPFTNGSVGEKHINESGEVKGEIFNDYENNTAAGGYTHAEGLNTFAIGEASHTEGYKTSTGFKGYSEVYHASFNNTGNSTLIIESTEPAKYYSIGDNLQIGLVDGSILKDKFKINEIYEINWGGPVPDATQIKLSKLTDEDITISISDIKYIGVYNKPCGDIVIAEGAHAHAEGWTTVALGSNSHSEGSATYAAGGASHAEGYRTEAIGENAHAEGSNTYANADGSHAEGYSTSANGVYSHAGGLGTIASKEAQTAIGKYNAEDSNALFIVGNGNKNTRSNAFTVNKDGSATLAKVGENDNNIATVGYLNAQLNALITVADIDTICGGTIVAASEVTF